MAKKPASENFEFLSEQVATDIVVDREKKTVSNVCLSGLKSKNGYSYLREAMSAALPLYGKCSIFCDHAEAGKSPTNRKLKELAAKPMNVRLDEQGRPRADLKLIGPSTEWLLDLFEASPSDIGMSQVVRARKNSKNQVDFIEKVISVDIVAFPATVSNFKEQDQGDMEQLKELLKGKKNPIERMKLLCEHAEVEFVESDHQIDTPPPPPVLTLESVADLREIAKEKPSIRALIEQFDQLQKDKWVGEVIAEQKLPDTDATKKALARCADKESMLECGKVLKEAVDSIKDGTKQAGREIPKPKGGEFTVDQLVSAFKG